MQDPGDTSDQQPMGEQPAVRDPWGTPSEPGAAPSGSHADMQLLAEARCRRALRCNQIGDNKKYLSSEECEATLHSEVNQELSSCSNGLNREALSGCIAAIEAKGCDGSMDRLSDYDQCRSTTLCAQ
jgi:hypothetical protein